MLPLMKGRDGVAEAGEQRPARAPPRPLARASTAGLVLPRAAL